MEEKKEDLKQQKNLSYKELANAYSQAQAYIKQLEKALYQNNMTNAFKRLDYLFKVVENENSFNITLGENCEFTTSCIKEIKETLTIPEDKK